MKNRTMKKYKLDIVALARATWLELQGSDEREMLERFIERNRIGYGSGDYVQQVVEFTDGQLEVIIEEMDEDETRQWIERHGTEKQILELNFSDLEEELEGMNDDDLAAWKKELDDAGEFEEFREEYQQCKDENGRIKEEIQRVKSELSACA